jgi:hypothetical protein
MKSKEIADRELWIYETNKKRFPNLSEAELKRNAAYTLKVWIEKYSPMAGGK